MLSCSCDYDDDYDFFYYSPDDFSTYPRKRRKKCVSCGRMIAQGETCVEFECYRKVRSDVEECIYGDERPLAAKFLCEQCGEIFFNLNALGYCCPLGDDLRELLKEYWDLTGFKGVNQCRT